MKVWGAIRKSREWVGVSLHWCEMTEWTCGKLSGIQTRDLLECFPRKDEKENGEVDLGVRKQKSNLRRQLSSPLMTDCLQQVLCWGLHPFNVCKITPWDRKHPWFPSTDKDTQLLKGFTPFQSPITSKNSSRDLKAGIVLYSPGFYDPSGLCRLPKSNVTEKSQGRLERPS